MQARCCYLSLDGGSIERMQCGVGDFASGGISEQVGDVEMSEHAHEHVPATDVIERLRSAGYKITPPRLAVLEVIEQRGEHLNPNEILEQARAIHPALGRATVYRTLELLTQLGIVRPIYVGESGPTYIRADGNHHHLVCSNCGKVVDFDQCVADQMTQELHARFGFEVRSHLLEFYGLCVHCQSEGESDASV